MQLLSKCICIRACTYVWFVYGLYVRIGETKCEDLNILSDAVAMYTRMYACICECVCKCVFVCV